MTLTYSDAGLLTAQLGDETFEVQVSDESYLYIHAGEHNGHGEIPLGCEMRVEEYLGIIWH